MKILMATLIALCFQSPADAYDPCWEYPAYEKADCYRQQEAIEQMNRDARQLADSTMDRVLSDNQQAMNRAQAEDQAIQQRQQLNDIIKELTK